MVARWRQQSRCLIQRRRLARLAQVIQIFVIEGAERGFDRGAEAGYAIAHVFAKKRRPDTGFYENSWPTNR
jgi:hypothetical protein